MKAKDYIINKLKDLVNLFPEMSFDYVYDELSVTHIIEVHPLGYYDSNISFRKKEAKIIFDFSNTFVSESIVFVSDESLIRVENPEFVIKSPDFSIKSIIDSYKNITYKVNCRHREYSKESELVDCFALAA